MPYMLVRHKVEDYDKWKAVFDEQLATRKASGSKGGRIFRNFENPNEVIFMLEWDDLKKIREFLQSQATQKGVAERAGVSDRPDVYFLEEVERPSA